MGAWQLGPLWCSGTGEASHTTQLISADNNINGWKIHFHIFILFIQRNIRYGCGWARYVVLTFIFWYYLLAFISCLCRLPLLFEGGVWRKEVCEDIDLIYLSWIIYARKPRCASLDWCQCDNVLDYLIHLILKYNWLNILNWVGFWKLYQSLRDNQTTHSLLTNKMSEGCNSAHKQRIAMLTI